MPVFDDREDQSIHTILGRWRCYGRLQAPAIFFECRSAEDTIRQRLQRRESDRNEASDASWTVYQQMRGQFRPFAEEIPQSCHFVIDTEHGLLSDLAALEEKI